MPAAFSIKPEEREFVVDSGASMQDFEESDEGDDGQRRGANKANKRKNTVYVKELDLFVKVMPLEETPAVLSLGKLCEDHGYIYHWISGQKPFLIRNGKRIN